MAYRNFITEYFEGQTASGKKPIRTGYARTADNAKKNIAVHLILGDIQGCGLGVVRHRKTGARIESLRANDLRFKQYNEGASHD